MCIIQSGLLSIKNKTNSNKHVICQLYAITKKVKSNPAVKKCAALKNAVVKKVVKSKVVAMKWL